MQTRPEAAPTGPPTDGVPPERGVGSPRDDFAELSRRVRADGLFARTGTYYAVTIPSLAAAMIVLAVTVVLLRHSWWSVAAAVAVAFVMAQLSFMGHDAGHRQVLARRRATTSSASCWPTS